MVIAANRYLWKTELVHGIEREKEKREREREEENEESKNKRLYIFLIQKSMLLRLFRCSFNTHTHISNFPYSNMSASPSTSSAAAATATTISPAVYAQARKLYDGFVAKVRTHLHIPNSNKEFGRYILKPSQLSDVMNQQHLQELNMLKMMRGPMVNSDGELMALSMDGDGKPISIKQFTSEMVALHEQHNKQFKQFQADVTENIESTRALANQHGTTVVALYDEINKQETARQNQKA